MNSGDATNTDRLERALRASLRPVDPGVDFTAALQARLAAPDARNSSVPLVPLQPLRGRSRGYSASLALAASIVVALAAGWQVRDVSVWQRTQQARIHSEVLLALEITSERLSLAQQRIEQYQSQEKTL